MDWDSKGKNERHHGDEAQRTPMERLEIHTTRLFSCQLMSNMAHNRTKHLLRWNEEVLHQHVSIFDQVFKRGTRRWLMSTSLLVTCDLFFSTTILGASCLNQGGLFSQIKSLLYCTSTLHEGSLTSKRLSRRSMNERHGREESIRPPRHNDNELKGEWKKKVSLSHSLRDDSFDSKWNLSGRCESFDPKSDLLRDARTMTCPSQEPPPQRRLPLLSGVPPSIQAPIEWDLNVL
jgi:hypothetical protein